MVEKADSSGQRKTIEAVDIAMQKTDALFCKGQQLGFFIAGMGNFSISYDDVVAIMNILDNDDRADLMKAKYRELYKKYMGGDYNG